MKHIINAQQFDRQFIESLFARAREHEHGERTPLRGRILATLFYEPSTRTRFSFESAMLRLGGGVLSTENARDFSSAVKGETLEDTARVVSNYADIIVLRHFEEGAAERAAKVAGVPVINAGDGRGQHPTQALLDLYTIFRELGRTDDLKVAMVGDLKNGRTVRSLAYLLGKFKNISITFVSPKELAIGKDITDYLHQHHVRYEETDALQSAVKRADVVYQTRIQKERFASEKEYLRFKGVYTIDETLARTMLPKTIIMHPLPRVDEIAPEVDALPQAAYFRQTRYGLFIRMALLEYVLSS